MTRARWVLLGWTAWAAAGAAGCAAPADPEAVSLLYAIAADVAAIRESHAPLAGFDAGRAFKGDTTFSHVHEEHPGTTPLMNPGTYWFKVSLAAEPVEAFDSPMPVLSVEIPSLAPRKYLKLRVRGTDEALTQELVRIVLERAIERGGRDPRVDLTNARELPPRGRRGRRGMITF